MDADRVRMYCRISSELAGQSRVVQLDFFSSCFWSGIVGMVFHRSTPVFMRPTYTKRSFAHSVLRHCLCAVKQNFRDIGSRRLLMSCVIAAALLACRAFETAGIDFLSWSGFPSDGHFIRPPSTLRHPNYMAAFLSRWRCRVVVWRHHKRQRWGAAPFYASVCLMSAAMVCLLTEEQ